MNYVKKNNISNNRFVKSVAGSFSLNIVHAGLGMISTLLITRLLGEKGFGIYAYVMSWASVLSIPLALGFDQLLIRETAKYKVKSLWNLILGLIKFSNNIIILISLLLGILTSIIFFLLFPIENNELFIPFFIGFLGLPLISIRSVYLSTIRGLNQVVLSQIPTLLLSPLLFIVILGFSYLMLKNGLNPSVVLGIDFLTHFITLLISIGILYRIISPDISNVIPEYQSINWIKSAFPLMLIGSINIINSRLDILMLGALLNPEAAGIYTVANRIAQMIVFILIAFNSVLAPTISSLYSEGNIKKLQQVVSKSSRIVFFVSLLFSSIIFLFGGHFLRVFGSAFEEGYQALVILTIGQLFNAFIGSVGLLLSMTGHEKYVFASVGIATILNILLNTVMVPLWGINGAATANIVSMIFWNIACLYFVRRELGINSTALALQ